MKISSHELMYELKLLTSLNLVMKFLQVAIYSIRLNMHETITYTAIKIKKMYDKNYKLIFFKSENKIIFKFHKNIKTQILSTIYKKIYNFQENKISCI